MICKIILGQSNPQFPWNLMCYVLYLFFSETFGEMEPVEVQVKFDLAEE